MIRALPAAHSWRRRAVQESGALEVYLLFTCIDTLPGQDRVDFGGWLEARTVVDAMDKPGMLALYEAYRDAHGVGRTLRRVFQELPDAMQTWLEGHVELADIKLPLGTVQDRKDFLRALFHYFYEYRRNPYTHASASGAPLVLADVGEIGAPDDWSLPRDVVELRFRWRSSRTWRLAFRRGVDDALVLRLILHAMVTHALGLPFTDTVLRAAVQRHRAINTLHYYLDEVWSNASLASAWEHPRTGKSNSLAWMPSTSWTTGRGRGCLRGCGELSPMNWTLIDQWGRGCT